MSVWAHAPALLHHTPGWRLRRALWGRPWRPAPGLCRACQRQEQGHQQEQVTGRKLQSCCCCALKRLRKGRARGRARLSSAPHAVPTQQRAFPHASHCMHSAPHHQGRCACSERHAAQGCASPASPYNPPPSAQLARSGALLPTARQAGGRAALHSSHCNCPRTAPVTRPSGPRAAGVHGTARNCQLSTCRYSVGQPASSGARRASATGQHSLHSAPDTPSRRALRIC